VLREALHCHHPGEVAGVLRRGKGKSRGGRGKEKGRKLNERTSFSPLYQVNPAFMHALSACVHKDLYEEYSGDLLMAGPPFKGMERASTTLLYLASPDLEQQKWMWHTP